MSSNKLMRALGLMSGTSMDGIDVALIDTDGEYDVQAGAFASYPYSPQLRAQLALGLEDARGIDVRTERPGRLALLEQYLTDLHAEAVGQFLEDFDVDAGSVDVIGFHGHTVLHRPERHLTVQIGDGPRLAALSGIDVVHDLRAADVAAGGVGAPLAPIFHQALASRQSRVVAILNIGGVANVTVTGGTSSDEQTLMAFDTGPGNALLDDWMMTHTGEPFDRDGEMAARGEVDRARLAVLMSDDYFSRLPPKALDRDSFDLDIVSGLSVADGAATLTAFTAAGIGAAAKLLPRTPELWIVTGGGRRNPTLVGMIADEVGVPVVSAEALELDGDAIEAQAWAYLAVRSLHGLAITFPGTTGVEAPLQGGVLARAGG